MTEKERLRLEIEQKKAELEILEQKESKTVKDKAIKLLSEYTIEEKCAAFDRLYKMAEADLKEKEEQGAFKEEKDTQYTWEAVMELLGRKGSEFWKYYNSLD